MTFAQSEFGLFLVVVVALYWLLPRRGQNLLLVAASFLFYGWIHPAWVLLLLYSAVLDYGCARGMAARPDRKLWFLRLSLLGNALLLGTFKYLDFFLENVATAISFFGLSANVETLGILLPVGISFYTFQTMSYTLDVYWGKIEARRNFVDYLLFVSFFPQLVAGPVERAGNLLPQFEADRTWSWEQTRWGVSLIVWGLFKKVVIADALAPYVNAIFATDQPSRAMAWAAALGFMVQMLADFSAYSDIARGSARLFGIELMRNFRHPYLAASPIEFWERWHISFSAWLRDYVFFPTYLSRSWSWLPMDNAIRATLLTMLFSGLWHGAAWHFVLWGVFWGVVQVTWQVVGARVPSWGSGHWQRPAQVGLMIAIGWIAHLIFREPSLLRLATYFAGSPLAGTFEERVVAGVMLAFALAGAFTLTVAMLAELYVLPRLRKTAAWFPIETSLWALAGIAIYTFARQTQTDFLYFQF